MDHVKAVKKQHPSKSLKEVLQMAAKTYKKGSGAATKKVVGKAMKKSGTAKKGKKGKAMKKSGTAKKGKGKGKGMKKGKSAKKGKKSKSSGRK